MLMNGEIVKYQSLKKQDALGLDGVTVLLKSYGYFFREKLSK